MGSFSYSYNYSYTYLLPTLHTPTYDLDSLRRRTRGPGVACCPMPVEIEMFIDEPEDRGLSALAQSRRPSTPSSSSCRCAVCGV